MCVVGKIKMYMGWGGGRLDLLFSESDGEAHHRRAADP